MQRITITRDFRNGRTTDHPDAAPDACADSVAVAGGSRLPRTGTRHRMGRHMACRCPRRGRRLGHRLWVDVRGIHAALLPMAMVSGRPGTTRRPPAKLRHLSVGVCVDHDARESRRIVAQCLSGAPQRHVYTELRRVFCRPPHRFVVGGHVDDDRFVAVPEVTLRSVGSGRGPARGGRVDRRGTAAGTNGANVARTVG